MRNYKKYRSFVLSLFADFLAGKETKNKVIYELIKIQRFDLQGKTNKSDKSMWFRFYKGDLLATDIDDLGRELGQNTWLTNCMQIAINNPKDFQIYYS